MYDSECTQISLPTVTCHQIILLHPPIVLSSFPLIPSPTRLSPSAITEGTVVDIPSPPGTYVNPDDVVIVLETDKVSVDVR